VIIVPGPVLGPGVTAGPELIDPVVEALAELHAGDGHSSLGLELGLSPPAHDLHIICKFFFLE